MGAHESNAAAPDLATVAANLKDLAREQLVREVSAIDAAAVTKEIVATLRQHQADVTWKVLGLDNRWGRWEVDRCNGRGSPLANWLAEEVKPALQAWLAEVAAEVIAEEREKAKSAIKAALRAEIKEKLQRVGRYSDLIQTPVALLGQELVAEAMAELRAELNRA